MEKSKRKLTGRQFPIGNTASLKYKKEYADEADIYIALTKDRNSKFLKQKNTIKGYSVYETRLKVKLPTVEGFAKYLGVTRMTLYNWAESFKKFEIALDRVVSEQKVRLINSGLSGDYNSTIAKLILSSNHGMKERFDETSDDKPISSFNDEQTDRIADRIANRKKNDGGASSKKKSN